MVDSKVVLGWVYDGQGTNNATYRHSYELNTIQVIRDELQGGGTNGWGSDGGYNVVLMGVLWWFYDGSDGGSVVIL